MADRLCIVACDNVRLELAAVLQDREFSDVTMACFQAQCDRPRANWHELDRSIETLEIHCDSVEILGGCCVSGFGPPPRDMKHCSLRKMEHCFNLFAGPSIVRAYLRDRAYILTPGWLGRWREYIKDCGFDQQTAREFFKESTRKLVLLDTGVNPDAEANLRDFSEYLDLPTETVPVGLDYFRLIVAKTVLEWRLKKERESSTHLVSKANRLSADRAMVLDLMGEITGIMTEDEAIDNILQLFTMLFAPGELTYVPVVDGKPGENQVCRSQNGEQESMQDLLSGLEGDYRWTESGKGFILRIRRNETLGVIAVDHLAFPEFREDYLNLALAIARVCGLAISNARTYKRLSDVTETLRQNEERQRRIAETLQRAMISDVSVDDSCWTIRARYQPALQEALVGGDFYDVFDVSDGRKALAIGDVSGKGLDAAVHTAMAKNMLRAFAHHDPSPSKVMERLNDAICSFLPGTMFITLFYAVLGSDGTLVCAAAGHEPPLIARHDTGEVYQLEVKGFPLGLVTHVPYDELAIQLNDRDLLVMFTDGITEARIDGKFFDTDGLSATLAAHSSDSEEGIIEAIYDAATADGTIPFRDDAAVLVVRVKCKNCSSF